MECDNHQLSLISAGLLDPKPDDEEKNYSEENANNIHSCDCNAITVPATKYLPSTYKSSFITPERLNELRRKVQEAIRLHKIFTVRGCFHTVRKALTERGWVEKSDWYKAKNYGNGGGGCYLLEDFIQNLPPRKPGETKRNHIAKCERNIMSRFLEHSAIDLLWTARREKSDLADPTKNQSLIVNRFCRAPFTSKEGICAALKDFHWYYEDGVNFPRCYNVWNPEELSDFVENFRLTACIGLLRWLVEHWNPQLVDEKVCPEGRVPSSCFQFAYARVKELLDSCLHNDIDDMEADDEDEKIWQHDWDVFLTHHFLITHEQATIKIQRSVPLETLLPSVKVILEEIKPHWPQYVLDGCLNVWIVKPANKCRGRGIQLMNNIKQITQLVSPPLVTKSKYVVQKYIERPLIIHNTKFDIRQWFLLTGVQPLQIWCYKECYLRFSSQKYSLMNYHESVHLTNYAIQKKYTNETSRDSRLPTENMWDSLTFQAYLRQIGKAELWTDQIYPGMQKAIIGTMLACQDSMDTTKNSNTFELYGADFMISADDFQPWLIEINASPDLAPSTSVTARMCPQVIEDTIKVVVDRKLDPNAETGSFEMIYKQVIPKTPAYMGLNLAVRGVRIKNSTSEPGTVKREKSKATATKPPQNTLLHTRNSKTSRSKDSQSVIMDLIDCLNMKQSAPPRITTKPMVKPVPKKPTVVEPKKEETKKEEHPKRDDPPPKPTATVTSTVAQQLIKYSLLKRCIRKSDDPETNDAKKEYTKRHASCGPKFQARFEAPTTKPICTDPSKMTCIGNKLTDTSITMDSLTPPSTSSDPHSKKSRSLEDLPVTRKSPAKSGAQKLASRNHVMHNNNTKLYIQAAANPQNTNMFAVGCSLRAWRSKYKNMLKIEKENFPDSIRTYKYFKSAAGPICVPIKTPAAGGGLTKPPDPVA